MSLNMYSAGIAIVSLPSSRSIGRRKSYVRAWSALGKLIIRSTAPMSVGIAMTRNGMVPSRHAASVGERERA